MSDALMNTYARLPVSFERGEGALLWDSEGNEYLDALGGIAVCGLGHAHPAVTRALCEQAGRLVHTSNLYGITRQAELAERLTRLAGMDRVFFSNSGAEANEAAIKLARLHGHNQGIETPTIVVTRGSFHGRTMATLTATGNDKIQQGFEPLLEGFVHVDYDDLEAIAEQAANPNVVAVMVEPITGEGGIRVPDENYLMGIRTLCDDNGWLMILDEIQTGMGRTGTMFACEQNGISPDVMTLAKGLGNGVPIGACLARGAAAEVLQAGKHGSTFGGNPLVCSAALAVIDTLEQDRLPARAAELGQRMLKGFAEALASIEAVQEIRGRGLMLGIQLDRPCGELVKQALQQGLLINVTAQSVVRLLPPLIITDAQADRIVEQVSGLIRDFVA
ncbi:MAG: acetylornithine transaminase [Gammaproteobacteria bacterium]|nr:acetylornithine transaminase [Gammaproteobacteria bacterium]